MSIEQNTKATEDTPQPETSVCETPEQIIAQLRKEKEELETKLEEFTFPTSIILSSISCALFLNFLFGTPDILWLRIVLSILSAILSFTFAIPMLRKPTKGQQPLANKKNKWGKKTLFAYCLSVLVFLFTGVSTLIYMINTLL